MKERRKRLLKSIYKKENPHMTNQVTYGPNQKGSSTTLTHMGMVEFEKEYELKEEQKNVII